MMLKSSKTNDFSNTILFSNTVKPVQTTTNFSPQMKKKKNCLEQPLQTFTQQRKGNKHKTKMHKK